MIINVLENVYSLEISSVHCQRIVVEISGEKPSTSKEPSDKSGGDKILTYKDKKDINKGMWQFNTLLIILFSKFSFLITFFIFFML